MNRQRPIILTLIASALIIAAYLFLRFRCIETSLIMDSLAILAVVTFFLEYHQNNKVNEAQFVIELNNQFINEGNIAAVEHDLEMYFTHPKEREKYKIKFLDKYALEKPEHQDFINYLVHLEGVAALVNDGVLRLAAINDLMAYRYFIAVNNPVVQQFELIPYQDFYQGLIKLFPKWARKNKNAMPMKETRLDYVLKAKRKWFILNLVDYHGIIRKKNG